MDCVPWAKNVIFDLDGTLVDSAGDVVDCLARACAANGISGVEERMAGKFTIGPPLPDMLRAMAPELTEAQRAAVVAAFRRCYDSCDLAKTTAREGVRDLLHALHDAGAILFVATNKPHLPARRVLTKTGILPLITDCIAPDAMPGARASKSEMISHLIDKWGMRKGSTCVVGDAATDVQAAHDNGLASVAVLSGYGDAEEIRRSRPTFTAESMRDVQAVLCPGKCANSHGAAETSSAPVVES